MDNSQQNTSQGTSANLEIEAVIGYKGDVKQGLLLHPDNEHIIFPLGSSIIVRNVVTREQTFLRGHDNDITCLKISPSGRYLASGQKTHSGFVADILVWDFAESKLKHRLSMHKVAVNSLDFSPDDRYLASVGGIDDKNTLIIWDFEQKGKAVYGTTLGVQQVNQIKFFNGSTSKICAATDNNVQILTVDEKNKKINRLACNMGNIKRSYTCLAIDANDDYVYAGTKTGDILEVDLSTANFKRVAPCNMLFSQGVQVIDTLPNGDLIVGAGDGAIAKISIQSMVIKCATQVLGSISSISFTADHTHFFCGTAQCNIYWVDASSLQPELRNTCHYHKINDVVFPHGYSEVFATCSLNDIRIWNAANRHEILRIQVPGVECYCVAFMRDGKSIISGWSDGKIRAFYPQSGKIMFVINDAHVHGVTSISATSDCTRIVSGGMEGEVRVWQIGRQSQKMIASMKEHRNRVWSIQLRTNNEEAVSCSSDGSCIIWDLKNFTRVTCFFESTLFKQVLYHPDESQVLTTGSDRKITYWGTFDGEIIRMLDGSEEGEINTLAINKDGDVFVSAGQDKAVKIWGYDDGQCYKVGLGHAGTINKVAISPNQKYIVSVGAEGAIIVWKMPQDVLASVREFNSQLMGADQRQPIAN